MTGPIKIGDIVTEKGSKNFGYLKVDESHATTISLPVGIINGERPGPTICFTGATGGSIYPGVEATIRLWRETDPGELAGTLISVPVVNVPMLRARIPSKNPIDDKKLNFVCFPGSMEGTLSDAIAFVLFNKVIKKSEYHVDLRGGDLNEIETDSMVYYLTGDPDFDDKIYSLAKISGIKWLEPYPLTEGRKKSLTGQCLVNGIVSVTSMLAEGCGRYSEEDIQKNLKFARNIMKYLGMIEGEVEETSEQYEFTDSGTVNAKYGGIWHPLVNRETPIEKGQITGYVKDLKGDILQEVVSPVDGICYVLRPDRIVFKGDTLYSWRVYKKAWE